MANKVNLIPLHMNVAAKPPPVSFIASLFCTNNLLNETYNAYRL